MSPQTTEEGSLAFARNMKLDDDGNLISDYGYKNISSMSGYNIVGHIVGLDNKIYFFTSNNKIIEYDEVTETKIELNTNWTYGGGEIDGYVNTNQSGEKILTIGEYLPNGSSIPLKHINLKYSNVEQSLYTQAPVCPTANLVLINTYVKTIPNGVYVFFIRYKIRKDVYTNWFLCSRPIFGGTSEKITTLQGGLNYINTKRDSAKSFVFQLDFAQTSNINSYKEFQLGFIITHDEATDARIWKHFDISEFVTTKPHYNEQGYPDENLIYFDYEDVKEANIDDLLETTYDIYNVRNIASFKNKLYISNYIESDFNPNIVETLKNYIGLSVAHTKSEISSDIDYKNMKFKSNNSFVSLHYDYFKGYYDRTINNNSIKSLFPSSYDSSNPLNYSITKLSKLETREKNDVVRFDTFWNGAADPDVVIVYNIYNDLHNKVIFGNDYLTPVPDDFDNATKIATVGLRLIDTGSNAFVYGPCYNSVNSANHPWFNLGFTFGFGSYKADEIGNPNYKLGCSVFNAYTFNFEPSYIVNHDSSKAGWFARDSGVHDFARSTIESVMQREIESRSFFAKAYLEIASGANTYLIDYQDVMDLDNYAGNNMDFELYGSGSVNPHYDYQEKPWKYYSDNHLTILDPSLFSTTAISDGLRNKIIEWVYDTIYNNIVGIDESGTPVLSINGTIIRANSISVKFKKFDFTLDSEDIDTSDDHYVKRYKVTLKTTDYTSLCTFSIKNDYIKVTDNGIGAEQSSTLMPLSTYQPYVHFVDEHNIITNGVKLPKFTTGIANSNDDVLYLKYTMSGNRPSNNFKSFFISLVNVGDIVMEGFGYSKVGNLNIVHCLEVDALLYNINDNITIKIYNAFGTLSDTFDNARYYSSGSNYPPIAFGNCGFVTFEDSHDWSGYKIYIIISRNKSNENIDILYKASSYIPIATQSTAEKIPDGYYGSWLSFVKKPSFELSSSCYVSGKDVYAADRTTTLALSDFKSFIQVQDSVTYFVRSNFNLNYLSLTQDINDSIFTVGSASSGVKQVAKVIDSAILSYIYELKAMYKDFANKYFRCFDTDYKTDFDNTIRVSHVLSDETFNNSVFKFTAIDYYNIPTDRGIIVNLFSIGNNIFVHTKDSFYKFDGNQTIAANNSDIQLQESEPFDIGISQIFDSEYGYGGIDTKQSGCITFDSYFFYDKSSNHIFAYGGNSQVQLIDGNIYKLLAYYKPSECKTLHDELNCRVLFEFTSSRSEHSSATYKTFTLSYNYKTKTFVSLHDLSLVNAFAGRHRAYSYKSALLRLFEYETTINTTALVAAMNVNKIFGNATTACIIEFGAKLYKKQIAPFGIAVVMFPRENLRETVNSIKYIADIQQKDPQTQSNPVFDVLVNPQVSKTNPVVNFYIVTDCCLSSAVNINVNDNARPNTLLDYKGFKFDMGAWTSNYFRNNINKTDIYQYGQKYPNRDLDADQNSLVYGRYFIIIFDFKANTPIKFEELFMNTEKY